MLTPPDLSDDIIALQAQTSYSIAVARANFLPIGADVNSAVYRLDATDGAAYFLKLRRADFDEIAVAVPAFLRGCGVTTVMAPIATTNGSLWSSEYGFTWIVYPYFDGPNGFERPLSDAQWVALGASLRAVHVAPLPPSLAARVPREDYSPRWRDAVLAFDRDVEATSYGDPVAQRLAAFWRTKRAEIQGMVERAADLGRALQSRALPSRALPSRALPFALCHSDLHAWNVLLGTDDEIAIVDWDNPIFAPKERDLMFIGGGVGAVWDTPREEALFYQGYGPTECDPAALAYYRYERIIADLAAYGAEIFGAQGGVEDRENGLRQVVGQFQPHRVVEIAHQTYRRLPRTLRA
jgi:spectinomycin phosphotransferase